MAAMRVQVTSRAEALEEETFKQHLALQLTAKKGD